MTFRTAAVVIVLALTVGGLGAVVGRASVRAETEDAAGMTLPEATLVWTLLQGHASPASAEDATTPSTDRRFECGADRSDRGAARTRKDEP